MIITGFILLGSFVSFLKIVSIGAVTTLAVQISLDEDFHRFLSKIGVKKVKKVNGFELGEEHCTVMGMTQYGKTYATLQTLKGLKEGVLFINPQLTKTPKEFVKADMNNSVSEIWEAVKRGQKVDYHTSDDLEKISNEVGLLIDRLYVIGKMDCRIVIDECHLLSMCKDKKGLNAGKRLASTGLSRGFKTVFISQRPATVDNSFYTQSTKHILFALGLNDYKYLKENGFPTEQIQQVVGGRKYVFCEFNQVEVKGAFTVG